MGRKGAEINIRANDGVSPLHVAASGGYIEIVRLLIDQGAEVDIKDMSVYTSLQPLFNSFKHIDGVT